MNTPFECRINRIISSVINCPPEAVQADKHLFVDLLTDSLMLTDIIYTLEHEFGIQIAESTLAEVNYVRDLYRVVLDRIAST